MDYYHLRASEPVPRPPVLPLAPSSMQKDVPLKAILGEASIDCLAQNIAYVYPSFDVRGFVEQASLNLEPLPLMQRAQQIAQALRQFLPPHYTQAIELLIASLTPAHTATSDLGLSGFFYLPHSCFIANYGQDWQYNSNQDPFEVSMRALYALTTRFTSEFAIRPFLMAQQERTLAQVMLWLDDENPHVRRLCSEGTRPKLPWGKRLPSFIANPQPTLPILSALKNDASLYVRRSVANHLGDIAKDHPELVFSICQQWLPEASKEVKWLIRHAVRYWAKKGDERAITLRLAAK